MELPVPFDKARSNHFAEGEMILNEGDSSDSIYMIESGQVEVVLEDQEQGELILTFLKEGEIFGEMSFFSQDNQRCAMIRAVTDTKVRVCDKHRFISEADNNRTLWMLLVEQLAKRLRSTNRRYSDRAFRNVKARVAHVIADLAQQQPEPQSAIRITRTDLGRIASCTREVAGQAVIELVEEGLVEAAGRTIKLVDSQALGNY